MSSRRRFSVTVPDWGQDHLSSDAIVAFVDNELAAGPHTRATQHLSTCRECAAQVVTQGQARSALRSAQFPSLPSSLLNSLRSIPQEAELPAPPAGLAMTADGQIVTVLRPELLPAAHAEPATQPHIARSATPLSGRSSTHRRLRFGAGAAVSGLAIGAIALAAPGFASTSATPTGPPERGVFNGPVLGGGAGVVDAQLRLTPGRSDPLPEEDESASAPTSGGR